jgi:hypothetical protein
MTSLCPGVKSVRQSETGHGSTTPSSTAGTRQRTPAGDGDFHSRWRTYRLRQLRGVNRPRSVTEGRRERRSSKRSLEMPPSYPARMCGSLFHTSTSMQSLQLTIPSDCKLEVCVCVCVYMCVSSRLPSPHSTKWVAEDCERAVPTANMRHDPHQPMFFLQQRENNPPTHSPPHQSP